MFKTTCLWPAAVLKMSFVHVHLFTTHYMQQVASELLSLVSVWQVELFVLQILCRRSGWLLWQQLFSYEVHMGECSP